MIYLSPNGLNLKTEPKNFKWLLISYTLDHLKVRVFFGRLSRAGVDQARSTFWSVTQSLLIRHQATITPFEEDT